ncbi:MAG: hypothetical protein K2G24_05505 [Muribaculaceae bacterium]|nr:hypothetical protein [Muribaculaceae bacterium]
MSDNNMATPFESYTFAVVTSQKGQAVRVHQYMPLYTFDFLESVNTLL